MITQNPLHTNNLFADVILPIGIPKAYTYWVPEEFEDNIEIGKRVEVQFGRSKIYSGIVKYVGPKEEVPYKPKPILAIIDEVPLLVSHHLDFWDWIAEYYFCTIGEVMHAAVPAGLKLMSETKVMLKESFKDDFDHLSEQEYLIAEALTIQHQLTLQDIRAILQKKTIYPVIHSLMEKGVLFIEEELKNKFKPKRQDFVGLKPPFDQDMNAAFELTERSEKQTNALLALHQLMDTHGKVTKSAWYKTGHADSNIKTALLKKEIIEVKSEVTSRIQAADADATSLPDLTGLQAQALLAIRSGFASNKPVLLYGVTGSGKTRLYIELANEYILQGKQVLYLLPEIALTTHLINRLQRVFGRKIVVFHSRLAHAERVEVWKAAAQDQPILLGARSSLFLPFKNLGLIIVDEEHDRSYKQADPAPRYNARDAAVMLAHTLGAQVVLGSATPSFESFYNVSQSKYAMAEMPKRIKDHPLPSIQVINLKEARKKKTIHEEFTVHLLDRIQENLNHGRQVILFQNRRGFSPYYRCTICGWHAVCVHCDVSQTYHKYFHKLICHYCNYQIKPPRHCPDCGSDALNLYGFGTEKIEEVLKELFSSARIGRMDLDTVRTRKGYENIIEAFEQKRIDILVGTQMVTKGLDFDSVGLVAIMNAEMILNFPDFRAHERAYQLMTQVAGRAGRKDHQGEVVIQSVRPDHPVIKDVLLQKFHAFYKREMDERQRYLYPPFYRLILVIIKHKKPQVCQAAAQHLAHLLKQHFKHRVKGPTEPLISRIKNQYIRHVLIKVEKDAKRINSIKYYIKLSIEDIRKGKGMSTVRFNVNVDPY